MDTHGAEKQREFPEQNVAKSLDFDELLDLVGARGRYQKLLLYAFLTPVILITPFFQFSSIFLVAEPDHWCHVPGKIDGMSVDMWKNLTIPREPGPDGHQRYSQCSMYDLHGHVVKCKYGWEYDRGDYEETLVSNFNWVCEKSHYATYALTINAVGIALGTVLFGRGADKLGRKSMFFIMFFMAVFSRALSVPLANNFTLFLLHQLVVGMASALMYAVPTMLACEVSDKDYRAWIYSYTWGIWVLGFSALPIIVWRLRRWDIVALATSVPGLLILGFWFWVLESPRWLLTEGRVEDCAKNLTKIARRNGIRGEFLQEKILQLVKSHVDTEAERQSKKKDEGESLVKKVVKRSRLLRNLLVLTAMCSANQIVNFGITLNTDTLYGNRFLNYFLLGVVEIPASAAGGYLANKLGRRWTQVFFYGLSLLACGASAAYYYYQSFASPYVIICLIVVVKFAITITFLVSYLQITESFPTKIRSTCSGVCNTAASVFNTVTPFLIHVGKSNLVLTYAAFAAILLITTVSSAFLPETNNRKLPDTMQEANLLGKTDKFWSLRPQQSNHENPEESMERGESKWTGP